MIFEESLAIEAPFDTALAAVKDALAGVGFGVVSEIDLQATLREKVGRAMDRYVLLGVFNAGLASRALDLEPEVGVLLPCTIVVRETPGYVLVEARDPGLVTAVTGRPALAPIVDEARRLLDAALSRLVPLPTAPPAPAATAASA